MTYSLSADFFQKINYTGFSDILFPLSNAQYPHIKMAVDCNNIIIDRYKEVLNNSFRDVFQSWLTLMSNNKMTSFAIINVDLNPVDKKEYCLKLASSIKGEKKLIVNSLQEVSFIVGPDDYTEYNGERILVIESSVAKKDINDISQHTNNIINVSESTNIKINQSNNQ